MRRVNDWLATGNFASDKPSGYARQSGFRIVLAFILDCNRRSIDLLIGLDFSIRGRLPNAANINEEHVDHVYLVRSLN